ncbi:hypothetical protein ABZ733_30990 [Streptomyces longwoodensis]|uniref:hypothetical protein n=1 Tax=Streptomyces longwoodensis TaxID=68231 RepID=UPI00340E5C44
MPESTTSASELMSQYKSQVASDLDRNLKERERITAELASLQEQLAALQHDHSVLVNVQQALGVAPSAPRTSTHSAPAPSRRQRPEARPRQHAKTAAARQPSPKKAVAKTAQPTLIELIHRHLAEQNEPRSAAEVATALSTAHPERGIKTGVVRTSLENLVARSRVQRTKQGSSVFYTVSLPPEPAASEAETAG